MRNLRILLLATIIILSGLIETSSVAAVTETPGGVSEQSSEPRKPTLTSTPTKWKSIYYKMGPSIKYWKKVAKCETDGNWQDKGNFGGGLGIAASTWSGYGGKEFASHPAKATMLEQIIVANRISTFGYQTKNEFMTVEDRTNNTPFFRSAVGFNGWGCIKHNNYLKPNVPKFYYSKLPASPEFYCPAFEPIFKKYGLPWKVFSYIAWRESRCDPNAFNNTLNSDGSTDSGLLQINSCWYKTFKLETGYDSTHLMNPELNALFASWILHFSSGRLSNWNIKARV
jgi:hypothetical protein